MATIIAAPSVGTLPRRIVRSSNYEEVRRIQSEHQSAWFASQAKQEQCINDWKLFFGWPGEQWSADALAYKSKMRQRAAQYNIIKPKVMLFHGSIISDPYRFLYSPADRKRTTAVAGLETAYESDAEEMGYEFEYNQAILDGCVHVGLLELIIETTNHPLGNLAFRKRDPSSVMFDPYWKSDRDSDCLKAWKSAHMTAQQIDARWDKLPSSPKLQEELKRLKSMGMSWNTPTLDQALQQSPIVQNAYQVIQCHEIQEIRTKRIIARNATGHWIPFPVTEDHALLDLFAEANGCTDWQTGAQIVPYVDKVHWVKVICPDLFLTDFVEYGKPEVQIQRLPYFQFTCSRDPSGRNMGLVAPLSDPQLDVNYSRSKIIDLLSFAQGGAGVYDKRRINDETLQADFERNHNDASRMFGVDGPPAGFVDYVRPQPASPEVVRGAQEAFDLSDRVVNVPAAMQAETQNSGEPASLFAMKLRQAKIGGRSVDDRVKELRRCMAEAYFLQARITYAGPERSFSTADGKKSVTFNKDLGDGMVLNRIDLIPRCSVIISEAPGNLSRQMKARQDLAQVLQSIPPGYGEHVAITIDELLKTTSLDPDVLAKLDEATRVEMVKARMTSLAGIGASLANQKNAEAAILNFQNQIDQLVAGMSQRMGPPVSEGELPLAVTSKEQAPVQPAIAPGAPSGAREPMAGGPPRPGLPPTQAPQMAAGAGVPTSPKGGM